MQIRQRLTLQFALIVATILLATMFYIYLQSSAQVREETYNKLRAKIFLSAAIAVSSAKHAEAAGSLSSQPGTHSVGENISLYNPQNSLAYQFHASRLRPDAQTLARVRETGELRWQEDEWAALAIPYTTPEGEQYVVIAEGNYNDEKLKDLLKVLIALFVSLMSLTAAAGWFFAGQALEPITKIMNQVDILLPSDLSKRLIVQNQKDEISRLASTFNNLLSRIEVAFHGQRMFLSNIAHELRNPLTVITTQLEIALDKDRNSESYRQTLQSVLEDVKVLNSTSAKLMQIAMVEGSPQDVKMLPLRFDELVWQVKQAVAQSYPAIPLHLEIEALPEAEEDLFILGNEALLKVALQNVVENACKFGEGKPVHLELRADAPGELQLVVTDSGLGIPGTEREKVFEPFYRGHNTEHVKGSGVGLSLVQRIITLHKAKIELAEHQPTGTIVTLTFQKIGHAAV